MTKGVTNGKYWDQYKQIHAGKRYGISGDRTVDRLLEVIDRSSTSLLDYGAGQANTAKLLATALGFDSKDQYYAYDPNVQRRNSRPDRTFDLVVCTDVMEHVPEDEVDNVLVDIWGYVDKEAFFVIALQLAGEILPNGENAHCTVQPKEWWEKKLRDVWVNVEEVKQFSNPYSIVGFKCTS
jgi:hypothetical protein